MTEPRYYTAAQTRELDRLAIEEHQIHGFELMQRAGKAAFTTLINKWPNCKNLIIFCGTGNNGGDGFIMGSFASDSGMKVSIYLAGDADKITGDARLAFEQARNNQLTIIPASEFLLSKIAESSTDDTVIIDALLGTGLKGNVREPCSQLIHEINNSVLPVLAIDIPSGLCSDTGVILGNAIKADLTLTFIGRKIGLVSAEGPKHCGELMFDSLDVPETIYSELQVNSSTRT